VALAIGGVGVAGFVLGGVAGLLAIDTRSSIKKACGGSYPDGCAVIPGSQDNVNSRLKTQATTSTVSLLAGGALVGAGAVLYLTAPRSHSGTRAGITLTPALDVDGAQLFARGAF
jgi:hypothetical protein